jgi:glycosyltransferase involved in cell wall biosynthesis
VKWKIDTLTTNRPTVSLLVAARNESAYIDACLRSLLRQDYPQELLEVLIYDGQSTDETWAIAERLIAGKINFRIRENSKQIQAAAWNLGIKECHGEIVSIVSGHAEFAQNYVSSAVETLLRTNADMVGGTVRARNFGIVGNAIASALSTSFGVGGANFRYTEVEKQTDTVFMGFCWRILYEKIGGYDEELVRNQDDEFSYRLRKAGGRIICNPKIVSYYSNRSSLGGLWTQYYHYGFWKIRVLQKHPRQMRLRQFVPPAFVAALCISSLLAFSPALFPLFLIIPVIYLMANIGATFWTAAKYSWRSLPLLPIIFAILHFSYGLGFLVGLVYFSDRWGDELGKVPSFAGERPVNPLKDD